MKSIYNTNKHLVFLLQYYLILVIKYRQQELLNHQMFVYNQAYNICLNLWKKEQTRNKNLDKKEKIYRSVISYDKVVKMLEKKQSRRVLKASFYQFVAMLQYK
jgi:REP element-mobilizing transposase RayT